MEFIPQDGIFELEGKRYIVKKAPNRLWPCQNCAFLENCLELKEQDALPKCKKAERKDDTTVVFWQYTSEMAKRDARRSKDACQNA